MAFANLQTGHIGVNVTDLDRSRGFYQQVFGFEILSEGKEPGRQFVFMGWGGKPVPALFPQSDGVVPHGEGMDSGGIFFDDPDGIRSEIYTPTGAGGVAAPTADGPTCGFF